MNYQLNTSIRFLVLSLLFCALAIPSFAYDFMVDGLAYEVINDSSVQVTHTLNPQNKYPFNYDGHNWKFNYPWLTKADIPEKVTYNGDTYTVTAIGPYAFAGCSLTDVKIPNTVISIRGFNSASVQSINIPASTIYATVGSMHSLGVIEWDAIDCEINGGLNNGRFSIGRHVETLPADLYNSYVTNSFTTLFVPSNVKSIGRGAFKFSKLKHLILEDATNLSIGSPGTQSTFAASNKEDVYFLKGEQIEISNWTNKSQTYYLGREVTKINTIDDNTTYKVHVPTPPDFSDDIVNNISQYESRAFYILKESTLAYYDHPVWSKFSLVNNLGLPGKVIMKTKTKTLDIGESFDVVAQFTGEATAPILKWTTNPRIAVYYNNDNVVATEAGEADIVAFCLDRFDTCHVIVREPQLTLDKDEIRLKIGESASLNAEVLPAAAKNLIHWAEDDFTYSINDEGIIKLQSYDEDGILSNSVTALSAGEADIYVKCCNQIKKCHVIVEDIPHVITLEPSEISLNPTDSYTIAVKFTQYVEDVVLENTDQKIANARLQTSSSGGRTVYVTALRPGKTTITVSAADGTAEPGTCVVTVNGALDGDVNCDGEVNTGDVSAIYGIILGTKPDNGRADLNGDSEVNVADVSALYGIILGVE